MPWSVGTKRRWTVAAVLAVLLSGAHAGRVAIKVQRRLHVPPTLARKRWLTYAWSQGGGLPLVASLSSSDGQARTLLPLMLRERLVPTADENDLTVDGEDGDGVAVTYVLESAGAMSADVVSGSHRGHVRFASARCANGAVATDLTWTVGFETRARNGLWSTVTKMAVSEVVANLEAVVAVPCVFTCRMSLGASPRECLAQWLDCFRVGDLDLPVPLPPPVLMNEGTDGAGCERLILPPALRERVLSVDTASEEASCSYAVLNPSWRTLYPVHTHRGEVSFTGSADGEQATMIWSVAVRPMRGGMAIVRFMTQTIVPAFARSVAERVAISDDAVTRVASDSSTRLPLGESGMRCDWSPA